MDISEAPELSYEGIIGSTDKAYHIKFSSSVFRWIAKSQCRIINNRLFIAEWLVKEKKLEDFICE